ncbi:MAG: hypothetical protein KKH97_05755 [Proteobacteria bacterium]|nr:hypothetical protein [Pseudomonadota bacterium]MBU1712529.1 hypothetical protein [Pseudomonadota bacterium]
MTPDPLSLFAQLGLPSAFIGMVLIAIIFKKTHTRVSAGAAVMAVILVAVYGLIQLKETHFGDDIALEVYPQEAYSFNASGPVTLKVSVRRGKVILKTLQIDQPSDDNFGDRLKNLGWRKTLAESTEQKSSTPQFWSTNRVYVGRPQTLGLTEGGLLKITAMQFTGAGEAVVTLELADKSQPIPTKLTIRNKGLEVQSFPEKGDFFIAVREADFTAPTPWASFAIFKTR